MVKGLRYLHSCSIVHGDIEAVSPLTPVEGSIVKLPCPQSNIIISDSAPPLAMLADLGSIRVTTTPVEMSSEAQGSAPFMAPEILRPADFGLDKGVPSKEADVYALGMTVYQVLTGKWPFFPRREAEVMRAVISGERPPRPENAEEVGMTEVVWDLLGECWKGDRTTRPTITEVLKKFREITGGSRTTDSTPEGSAAHRSHIGKHSSVFSQNSSLTIVSYG